MYRKKIKINKRQLSRTGHQRYRVLSFRGWRPQPLLGSLRLAWHPRLYRSVLAPPPVARLEDYHWDITGEPRPPPVPKHRELRVHVIASIWHGWALWFSGTLGTASFKLQLYMTIDHSMSGARRFLCIASRPLANACLQGGCRCHTEDFSTGKLERLRCYVFCYANQEYVRPRVVLRSSSSTSGDGPSSTTLSSSHIIGKYFSIKGLN